MVNTKHRYQFVFLAYFAAANGLVTFRNAYFQEIGLSGGEMGFLGALLIGGGLLAQPLWGMVADTFNATKQVLLIGIVMSGLAALLFPLADTVTWTLQLLIVATLSVSVFRAPIVPVITSMVLSEGIEYGHVRAVGSLAFGIGSFIVGWVITVTGLTAIFYVYALGMGVLFVTVLRIDDPSADMSPDLRRDALSLLGNRQFALLLVVGIIVGSVISADAAFLSVYMLELTGSDDLTGIAWLVKTVGEASLFVAVTAIGFDNRTLLSMGILGSLVTYAVLGLAPATPLVIGVMFLSGGGLAMFLLAAVRMTHNFAPAALATTGQALLASVGMGIGRVLGQLASGQLVDFAGVVALYHYLAVVAVFALAVSLVFHVNRRPASTGS